MENLGLSDDFASFWRNRRVLVTGHTGFKGGWLTFWLHALGAQVAGYSLAPSTQPSLFVALGLDELCEHHLGDVRDLDRVQACMLAFKPEVVLHLAAQPIVLEGYADPLGTYATNVMGTLHVLQAVRRTESVAGCVVVTTDKCYENREWTWPYREIDALGGHDPYSSSKACAEIATASFRRSFFADAGPIISTARAGNVVGGGDWSPHRLVPDLARSFAAGTPARLRNPTSTRPWQHVLDPLRGYLMLAERAARGDRGHARAYNFGPDPGGEATVEAVAAGLASAWGDDAQAVAADTATRAHEARLLTLDSSLARRELGWRPRADLDTTLRWTADWYRAASSGAERNALRRITEQQIAEHAAS